MANTNKFISVLGKYARLLFWLVVLAGALLALDRTDVLSTPFSLLTLGNVLSAFFWSVIAFIVLIVIFHPNPDNYENWGLFLFVLLVITIAVIGFVSAIL